MASYSYSSAGRVDMLLAQVRAEVNGQQQKQYDDWQRHCDLQYSELHSMKLKLESLESRYKTDSEQYQDKIRSHEDTISRLESQLAATKKTPFTVQGPNSGVAAARDTTPRETWADWAHVLDLQSVPPQHKQEGGDWYALFNPQVPRSVDISLLHTIEHDNFVCCVRFSHDGKYFATASHQSVQIYEVATGTKVSTLSEQHSATEESFIRSLSFSPDGQYIATGSEDKVIRVWDIYHQRIERRLVGHTEDIYSVEFTNNGQALVSGGRDATVRVWDVKSETASLVLTARDGISSVSVSLDMKYVAASCHDGSIHVWSMYNGELLDLLTGPGGHGDSTYCMSFLPNSTELVSGSLDRTVKLWALHNLDTVQRTPEKQNWGVRTLQGHQDYVVAVSATPDSLSVLSGSKDRSVQMWDVRTGEAQFVLHGHKNTVLSVASSRDCFATGGGDKVVRVWSYSRRSTA